MEYKEMMKKTALVVVGMVRSVNVYISKKGQSYHSVDLDVIGIKMPINIKLDDNYDRSPLVEGELAKLNLIVRPGFENKGIELRAV